MGRFDILETDLLIVGGGAAGCAAAVEAAGLSPRLRVTVAEKAHISRSGCLAMGLNAVNAYLPDGMTPEGYLEHVRKDSHGIVRDDLVLSVAQGVNAATHRVESWGLPIPRDRDGRPLSKGPRSIRILGEGLKPLLAKRVQASGAQVLNRHSLFRLRLDRGRAAGAYLLDGRSGRVVEARARAVILATGGASGLYRTRNQGEARNRMWYSPFNTGTGYAAALEAGAELTTLEMRFIPTRIRSSAAPTGTLAQTFGARELNVLGEPFNDRWARQWGVRRLTSPQRVRALLEELKAGRGPAYLRLEGLEGEKLEDVLGAYLDMTPVQVALWAGEGIDPRRLDVEIGTSGPYVLGGHTGSGLWVDVHRRTTVPGLYAAGDVAGGCPKKYVSGAWVEGFIAARTAVEDLRARARPRPAECPFGGRAEGVTALLHRSGGLRPSEALERLQRIMDEYAGGVSTFYEVHGRRLEIARREMEALEADLDDLSAQDPHELLLACEVRDRAVTCRALIAHLLAREETRWPGFQTRLDFPHKDGEWDCFVNSKWVEGRIDTLVRPLGGKPCRPESISPAATDAGATRSRPASAYAPATS